jgi:hypothetical protein
VLVDPVSCCSGGTVQATAGRTVMRVSDSATKTLLGLFMAHRSVSNARAAGVAARGAADFTLHRGSRGIPSA